jgi:hypothetical protein
VRFPGRDRGEPMTDGDEYRAEAERLANLPRADQRKVIALHRSVAANPKLPTVDRRAAAERADALERHLRRLNRRTPRGRKT